MSQSGARRRLALTLTPILLAALVACASAKVREASLKQASSLQPPPTVIWVEEFELPPGWSGDPEEQERARALQRALNEHAVEGLTKRGYPAQSAPGGRADASTTTGTGALVIRGQLAEIEPGNGWLRVLIGFGAGSSRLRSQITMDQWRGPSELRLYEFDVDAHGSRMPGLIVPIGLGSELGLLINGLTKGAGEVRGPLGGDAKRTGEKIAERLAEILRALQWHPGAA